MRVYGSNAIRNVAFVGHGAAGKTTLVDALAFVAGSTKRHGSIPEGTTLTDYSADETERKHSISLGLAFAEWADIKINLLDAPGFLDFLGEATAALHSADAAVVVLSATGGVEVGTEKVWEICDRLHLPRLLFVGQMIRRKGIDVLLDALLLLQKMPGPRPLLLGRQRSPSRSCSQSSAVRKMPGHTRSGIDGLT